MQGQSHRSAGPTSPNSASAAASTSSSTSGPASTSPGPVIGQQTTCAVLVHDQVFQRGPGNQFLDVHPLRSRDRGQVRLEFIGQPPVPAGCLDVQQRALDTVLTQPELDLTDQLAALPDDPAGVAEHRCGAAEAQFVHGGQDGAPRLGVGAERSVVCRSDRADLATVSRSDDLQRVRADLTSRSPAHDRDTGPVCADPGGLDSRLVVHEPTIGRDPPWAPPWRAALVGDRSVSLGPRRWLPIAGTVRWADHQVHHAVEHARATPGGV